MVKVVNNKTTRVRNGFFIVVKCLLRFFIKFALGITGGIFQY